jgi:squalene-hopene/tetraprenyl-beta-curcumene cyclase
MPRLVSLDRAVALREAIATARDRLSSARGPAGYWRGRLASSPLAAATAAMALHLAPGFGGQPRRRMIERALAWIAASANPDGGFGDTPGGPSNLPATALCWAVLAAPGAGSGPAGPAAGLRPPSGGHAGACERARAWIERHAGGAAPGDLVRALGAAYGPDRTFAAPILAMCALSGVLGDDSAASQGGFAHVPQLPFELSCLPAWLYRHLRLQVVSYALPALIAIGALRHHRRPSPFALVRLVREHALPQALRLLERIQPEGGGFLEAVPLTAFVVMALAAAGRGDHPVVRRGVEFLERSARPDGSWPIDSDLATWVTTQAVEALADVGPPAAAGPAGLVDWLLAAQRREPHPYTGAAPGGWGWTDRPGAVPDADDTAGALIALARLAGGDPRVRDAATRGVRWLVALQNPDGGIPTFCRGWGRLPFDASAPDLTAHAMRAVAAWHPRLPAGLARACDGWTDRALAYLLAHQEPDGRWEPLWFGNPAAPGMANPTYGTARVVIALAALAAPGARGAGARARGAAWLAAAQDPGGGWGGDAGVPPSVEETGVALAALADDELADSSPAVARAVASGTAWLVERVRAGGLAHPAAIGLYFARLWYSEATYPAIFALSALSRLSRCRAAIRS